MSRNRYLVTGTAVGIGVVAVVAVLSAAPSWRSLPEDTGVVSLSFTHGGARTCRDLTEDEMARLPANMRRKTVCDRGRANLRLELDMDGETVLSEVLQPGGFAGDGPARVYERFQLPAGPHELELRMADSGREEGFDHVVSKRIDLAPAENFVIDFRPESGGFVFE